MYVGYLSASRAQSAVSSIYPGKDRTRAGARDPGRQKCTHGHARRNLAALRVQFFDACQHAILIHQRSSLCLRALKHATKETRADGRCRLCSPPRSVRRCRHPAPSGTCCDSKPGRLQHLPGKVETVRLATRGPQRNSQTGTIVRLRPSARVAGSALMNSQPGRRARRTAAPAHACAGADARGRAMVVGV